MTTAELKKLLKELLLRNTGKIDDDGLLSILLRNENGKYIHDQIAKVKELIDE